MWINKKNILAVLAGLLVVVVIGIGLNALTPKERSFFTFIEEERTISVAETDKTIKITVREGFCLSEISHDLGTNWRKVAELNGIKNANLILPGQKIKVYPFDATDVVKVSWYGPGFHGKTMANGKTYNMNDKKTVAHKWLPFGTKVRLTRIDNNKQIEVIVRDRGPYVRGRIFDLSKRAAEELGMIDEGLTICTVKILN